ncbi:MAG: DNA translocase FtsK 4TM domain-containing protein [Alphaproteobacteria bacterium]|nr:DNA translocase FtsK 4TM domain-containing protein [Alphaproteobacteria bacterium]
MTRKQKRQILPESLARFFKHRLDEIIGLTIFGFLGAFVLALISYTSSDPSFNTASESVKIDNYLGTFGAYSADLFLQSFGLSVFVLVLGVFLWGVSFFRHMPLVSIPGRILSLLIAVLSFSLVLAPFSHYDFWPMNAGLGGITGDLLLTNLLKVLMPLMGNGLAQNFIQVFFFLLSLFTFMLASSIPFGLLKKGVIISSYLVFEAITIPFISLYNLIRQRPKISMPQSDIIRSKPAKKTKHKEQIQQNDAELFEQFQNSNHDYDVEIAGSDHQPSSQYNNAITPIKKNQKNNPNTYVLPPYDLLNQPESQDSKSVDRDILTQTAQALEAVLQDFGVKGEIIKVHPGPVVTLYELMPSPGTKSSRVISLSEDIARTLCAVSVRIAVIPGKNAIGIEIPNDKRQTVYMRELLVTPVYENNASKLPMILGKDIGGGPIVVDLARMPHLLMAGTTGSGKSVAINTMILSLLFKHSPEQCRLIMVDPKMLELSVYDGIPHLLAPVVTDSKKAIVALRWAVREMENRYKAMSKLGVRNIEGYNVRLNEALKNGENLKRRVQTGYDEESGDPMFEDQELASKPFPYIVVIVDELADLMMVAGKDIEAAIQRLAQMARAAGIHLIVATQRPSVDVITGTIKANFPTRISFQVTSKIDSRTILGEGGAESLLGQGDMLYMAGGGRIIRVHGPFVKDEDVEHIVQHLKSQGEPSYLEEVTKEDENSGSYGDEGGFDDPKDDLYAQAVQVVLKNKKASTSFVQRQLQLGYNRAATLIERMENEGVISAPNHAGKREILIENRE